MDEVNELEGFSPQEIARLKETKKRLGDNAAAENIVNVVPPDDLIHRGTIIGQTPEGHDIIEPPKTSDQPK